MSDDNNNPQTSSFPIDDYVEFAVDLNIANKVNGKQMDKIVHEVVAKAKDYKNQCRRSDAQVASMKKVIFEQMKEIHRLRNKLDRTSKKLKLSETVAKANEIKYNQLYGKLKAIVLDTAADPCDNESNNNA